MKQELYPEMQPLEIYYDAYRSITALLQYSHPLANIAATTIGLLVTIEIWKKIGLTFRIK